MFTKLLEELISQMQLRGLIHIGLSIGIFLFGIFDIYLTYLVLGKHKEKFECEDTVTAVLTVLIIVSIFCFVVSLMTFFCGIDSYFAPYARIIGR